MNKKFIVKKNNRLDLIVIYADNISIKYSLINIMYIVLICSGFYLNNQYCGSSTLLNLFLFAVLCIVFLSDDSIFRKKDVTKNKISSKKELLEYLDQNITNQYTVDYVQQLEQELAIGKQEDGLTNARFNQIESTYEKAKHQNPNHPSVKTFVNIAREYYRQRISQAKKNGLNTSAYEDALQRYTQ